MHIYFVCDTMGAGGAERVISTLANQFVDKGHRVSICMLSNEADGSFYPLNNSINLFKLQNFKAEISFFKKAKLLRESILKSNPDIVISFLSYVCIYTWWALRKSKIPYIVSERNDPHRRSRIKQFLLNKSFKKAVGCVFQTEDAYLWYKKIISNRYEIIYNPVTLQFVPHKIDHRKNQVLYVGRLDEQKNVFMLIDAFEIFLKKHNDFVLKIYGDGPLEQQIHDYITNKKLRTNVELRHNSNKWQELEYDSKVFVLPSKFEGMPNALSEALCLGIPCVSTNCPIGGPKELKRVFPNTLILASNVSKEAINKAMEKALNIEVASSIVPSQLSSDKISEQWLVFIDKLIKKEK